jgi:hypothetical protein
MEFIDSIPFSENSQQTLPTNGGLLPNDRFLHSLLLEFRGRLTMPGSAGPTAALADSIAAIMERVTIEGYHRVRRQQEKIIDVRGADLELEQRFYLPTRPIYQPSTISVSASAQNDILVQVVVPFVPLRVSPAQVASYLLDAPNYESLKLTVQWGDFRNLVVAGTNAPTWSAFGSGSGSPTLRVYGNFAMNSNRFAGFVPGRVFRWFQEVTGSPVTTSATQVRLLDAPRGYDIRKVLLKSGVKATGTSAGNNAFQTLTDFLTDLRFNIGLGKYTRRWLDGNACYADLVTSYNLPARVNGINIIDFAPNGDVREALNTRPFIAGPSGNVDVYISADVAGAANQALVAVFEELRYRPLMAR